MTVPGRPRAVRVHAAPTQAAPPAARPHRRRAQRV